MPIRKDHDSEKKNWWRCILGFEQNAMTKSDWRRQRLFLLVCFLWALSYVTISWIFNLNNPMSEFFRWILFAIPVIFGILAFFAYLRFITHADELIQKINMEGLAIGFGLGAVYNMSHQLLSNVQVNINDMTLVIMMVGWSLGVIRATRRYQ